MLTSENKLWFKLYKAAMLELDPVNLPERVSVANEAVQLRLKELGSNGDHHPERQEIEYALNCLRMLEREK